MSWCTVATISARLSARSMDGLLSRRVVEIAPQSYRSQARNATESCRDLLPGDPAAGRAWCWPRIRAPTPASTRSRGAQADADHRAGRPGHRHPVGRQPGDHPVGGDPRCGRPPGPATLAEICTWRKPCSRSPNIVGDKLREVIDRDAQIRRTLWRPQRPASWSAARSHGEPPRLFEIYSAGNFVEASPRVLLPADRRDQVRQADPRPGPERRQPAGPRRPSWRCCRSTPPSAATCRSARRSTFCATRRTVIRSPTSRPWTMTTPIGARLRDGYSTGLTALVDDLPAPPRGPG